MRTEEGASLGSSRAMVPGGVVLSGETGPGVGLGLKLWEATA